MARLLEIETLPLRVTRHAEWLHGDAPLHPRVAELFARHVVPRVDGSYLLKIGFDEQPLEVDGTAFFVRRVELDERDGALASASVCLSDGAVEPLACESLMQGEDNALYCRIERHGLSVPARFLSTPYNALMAHADLDDGGAVLVAGGRRWPIRAFDPAPRAAAAGLAGASDARRG